MRRGGFSVEIIATGDEILFGRILDTNSNWMARRLADLGAHLRRVTCVGDEVDEIAAALGEAMGRGSRLILFTGGLGPSEDDMTVDAIGSAVGRGVVLDPGGIERIRRSYSERHMEFSERAARMARVVEGARPLANPVGLSTGMMLEVERSTVVTFPGIPDEMRPMFEEYVVPFVEERSGMRGAAHTLSVRMVWREFFPMYREMQRDYPDVYIKNAATPPESEEGRRMVREIKVDVVVEEGSREESEDRMGEVLGELRRRVGSLGGSVTVLS